MCLILFSYMKHPEYRLVLAANRDEFYERPTLPAGFWEEDNNILAGRDLQAGGTWLGITRTGRFAAITNYREPEAFKPNAPSRGKLISGFLQESSTPCDYLREVAARSSLYNGFNILAGDTEALCYFSNRDGGVKELAPGMYGLSNHLLDTPWPKVDLGKKLLGSVLNGEIVPEKGFRGLRDRTRPGDSELPRTGVTLEWERVLSSIFITSQIYGTRSSTLITIDYRGNVNFMEQVFNNDPEPQQVNKYTFRIE
jgi:uncharacterized protein with NRDE domain